MKEDLKWKTTSKYWLWNISATTDRILVHNGKCCVSEFECGLCDMKVDTLENLETHLASCEVYECEECEKRFTKLSDIKLHLEDDHNKDKYFYHLKMHRIVKSKVDSKKYSYNDVWKV